MATGPRERLRKIVKRSLSNVFGTEPAHPGAVAATASQTRADSSASEVDQMAAATISASLHPPVGVSASHSLTCGQTVAGRFRVLRFINSGGMGEVFEAWDSELKERVALKTIRHEIASFSLAIERFKEEVRQARAISHENVCRVYEVFNHVQESGEVVCFLTMELLSGPTLAECIQQRGPLEPKQAAGLVEQMVAGLAAAHEHGVVHRDFKSSNVILVDSPMGKTRAVVTDFGLALNLLTGKHACPEESKQGTPRYMAPEQVQGGEVGFAADQYALGVVMCEMLTGRCPPRPEHASDRGKLELQLGHHLSARWEHVIRRCLEFRPEDRFPSIKDVASRLNPGRRSRATWVIVLAAAASLAFSVITMRTKEGGDRVEAVSQLTPDTDLTSRPSLSRDGETVAYSSDRAESGNLDIWVQHLPAGTPRRLTTNPAEDQDPNLAPDGSAVVFRSERDGGGIYIVDVADGNERLLAPHGRNPHFSPDGLSVAYWTGEDDTTIASAQLFLLSLKNGKSVRLAEDFIDARYPVWSSDGKHILFSGCRSRMQPMPGCSEWWVTARDNSYVKETGTIALLRKNNIQLADVIVDWSADRLLLSGRQDSAVALWEVILPQSTLRVAGKPRQLTRGEARAIAPSIAANGTIAFEHLNAALHIWRIEHASDPSKAVATKVTQDPTIDISPSISFNGDWLVFARGYVNKREIWIKNMRTGNEDLFLSGSGDKLSPIVDESGQTVVLETREKDSPSLMATARGGPARTFCPGCSNPTGWFDAGSVFCREGVPSKIQMVNLATATASTILEKKGVFLSEASWSRRNQYLLFTASTIGTTKQIFAVLFPRSLPAAKGDWIPFTAKDDFSDRPRWSSDGRIVFYLSRRDGFSCLWGQRFAAETGRLIGPAFPVMHYHNRRFSPESVVDRSFNLSVAGDSIYLNIAEINTSVWVGQLRQSGILTLFQGTQ